MTNKSKPLGDIVVLDLSRVLAGALLHYDARGWVPM